MQTASRRQRAGRTEGVGARVIELGRVEGDIEAATGATVTAGQEDTAVGERRGRVDLPSGTHRAGSEVGPGSPTWAARWASGLAGWRSRRASGWRGHTGLAGLDEVERAAHREHADHGGRGEAEGHGHGLEPPRHAQGAPLTGVVDLVEGGVDDAVGQLVAALGEVRDKEAVELGLVGHRSRPPAIASGRSSASMAARIARWA